jgi:hypothetical protein
MDVVAKIVEPTIYRLQGSSFTLTMSSTCNTVREADNRGRQKPRWLTSFRTTCDATAPFARRSLEVQTLFSWIKARSARAGRRTSMDRGLPGRKACRRLPRTAARGVNGSRKIDP